MDARPADLNSRKEIRRENHWQHHHAAGRSLRHPDATVALGSPAVGAGFAIHLAARACHAGHVELCHLCRKFCVGHDVPHQRRFQHRVFLAWTSALVVAIYLGIVATRFERWGGLAVTAWDVEHKSDVFLGRGVRLFVTIPDLGWLFVIALLGALVPLVLYFVGRTTKDNSYLATANKAVFVGILLQLVVLGAFILRAKDAAYASPYQEGLYPTSLAASPFMLGGMVTGIFASLLYLLLLWRRDDLQN